MKIIKKKEYAGTVRKIYNDDKTSAYGVMGTVQDLMEEKILTWCDYPPETWMFIPAPGQNIQAFMGAKRDNIIEHLKKIITN